MKQLAKTIRSMDGEPASDMQMAAEQIGHGHEHRKHDTQVASERVDGGEIQHRRENADARNERVDWPE
jgi:hypothetical protein